MSNLRPFGFEFELFHPTMTRTASRTQCARDLRILTGIDTVITDDRFHSEYTKWQLKYDGSVSGGGGAWELVAPTMQPTQANFDILKKACTYLNEKGYDVNATCGLHVHIDGADLSIIESAAISYRYQKCWDEIIRILPRSRHANNFCRQLTDHCPMTGGSYQDKVERTIRNASTVARWSDRERYVAVNLQHAAKARGSRRIEFRHHSGTVNYEKAVGWYTLMCDFMAETLRIVREHNGQSVVPVATSNQPTAVVRRQRRRGGATTSTVVAMAPARVPYIEPGSDYDQFLQRLLQNGVITTDDAREFGWVVAGRSDDQNSRLRVTAHWLRRNGAALVTTHRNGELAYVPANGATTMVGVFANPRQVRRRLPVASNPDQMAFTPGTTVTAQQSTTACANADELLAKLAAAPLLQGVTPETVAWYESRKAAFPRRP
jgi:hypothetical protein